MQSFASRAMDVQLGMKEVQSGQGSCFPFVCGPHRPALLLMVADAMECNACSESAKPDGWCTDAAAGARPTQAPQQSSSSSHLNMTAAQQTQDSQSARRMILGLLCQV
jgi:hypothetical protein